MLLIFSLLSRRQHTPDCGYDPRPLDRVPARRLSRPGALGFAGGTACSTHLPGVSGEVNRSGEAYARGFTLLGDKDATGIHRRLPTTSIIGLEVAKPGNRRGAVLRGLGIGAVVGLVGFKVWADHHYVDDEFNAPAAVIVGVPAGAVIGALIGAAVSKVRWP